LYRKLEDFPEITDFDKLEHRREVVINYAVTLLKNGDIQIFSTGIIRFIEHVISAQLSMRQYNREKELFKIKVIPCLLCVLAITGISIPICLNIFPTYKAHILYVTMILYIISTFYLLYRRNHILNHYSGYQSKRDNALHFYDMLQLSIDSRIGGRELERT